MSRYEKKMKDKLDDEIKLAGRESLVPEELDKHLILNSNRLRTFEDARLEVVTYVEAKFGLRIRDSKPSDTGARGHSLVFFQKKTQKVPEWETTQILFKCVRQLKGESRDEN